MSTAIEKARAAIEREREAAYLNVNNEDQFVADAAAARHWAFSLCLSIIDEAVRNGDD